LINWFRRTPFNL